MALRPSELIDEMQTAFGNAWQAAKGFPAPAAGTEDRRLIFAAVAHGLLKYLADHHDEVLTRITFKDDGQDEQRHTVVGAAFDIDRD